MERKTEKEARKQKSVINGVNVKLTPNFTSSECLPPFRKEKDSLSWKTLRGKSFLIWDSLTVPFGCVCLAFPQSSASLERGYETE